MRAAIITGLVVVGSFLCGNAVAVPILSPFINELHYDNTGPDIDEFVEIAGSAQSLTGFSLVLYNGGTGRSYRSVPLQSDIPDQEGGFGAVAVFLDSLQNGPADGIALVDAMNRVVEWLSYEGQLLALDGPAMGMLSNALGVFQTPGADIGSSLQRTGTGASPTAFAWVGPLPNSPGSINAAQRFLATATAVSEPGPLLLVGLGLVLMGGASHRRTPSL